MHERAASVGLDEFDADLAGFNIDAAFQEAMFGVASDAELALEEKVRRMEMIIMEGSNEFYRGFVNFRAMAMQIEMMCHHDHSLLETVQGSEMLTGFLHSNRSQHDELDHDVHDHSAEDDEVDPVTGKKKKKRRKGWFELLIST